MGEEEEGLDSSLCGMRAYYSLLCIEHLVNYAGHGSEGTTGARVNTVQSEVRESVVYSGAFLSSGKRGVMRDSWRGGGGGGRERRRAEEGGGEREGEGEFG